MAGLDRSIQREAAVFYVLADSGIGFPAGAVLIEPGNCAADNAKFKYPE